MAKRKNNHREIKSFTRQTFSNFERIDSVKVWRGGVRKGKPSAEINNKTRRFTELLWNGIKAMLEGQTVTDAEATVSKEHEVTIHLYIA